jgi:hypothetical protein
MARFHVESKHTKKECLADLDQLAEKPDILKKFEWGCMSGTHAGYATLEGESESQIRSRLPAGMRERAKIVPVGKVTPRQIRAFHQM